MTALALIAILAVCCIFIVDNSDDSDAVGETSGSCGDNLTWSYDPETGTLTITGTGDMTNNPPETRWGRNTLYIKSVSLPAGLTSIGNRAFSGCESLTTITIPDSVTSIGSHAFQGCASLTSVIIPYSVTSIKNSAFEGCTSLTSVTIPDSVTSIGVNAFSGCTSLTSVVIPDKVTYIGLSVFEGCSSIPSFTIPKSVTSIGMYAFSGCTSLASITIPDSVTYIADAAFYDCTSLTSVVIPDKVTYLGVSVFNGCTSLDSVIIPDLVTSIENNAFMDCTSLSSVIIPNSVTSIGERAFYGCTSLTSVTIPDSITSISGGAFTGCNSLTSITIPDSITSISGGAFWHCTSLKEMVVGNCSGIDRNAFPNHWFYEEGGSKGIEVGSNGFYNHRFLGTDITKMIRDSGPVQKHLITYEIYEGSGTAPTQADVMQGSTITVKSYSGTKTGYTFGGWSYNGQTYKAGDKIIVGTSDITLLAIWNPDAVEGTIGSCGDSLTWSFDPDTGSLSITGTGNMMDYSNSDTKWGGNAIRSVTLPVGLTSIGQYAFVDCRYLFSAVIPDSVTYIGNNAFHGCTSLKEITVGNCSGISNDAFPDHRFYAEDGTTEIPVNSERFYGHTYSGTDITKMILVGEPVHSDGLDGMDMTMIAMIGGAVLALIAVIAIVRLRKG